MDKSERARLSRTLVTSVQDMDSKEWHILLGTGFLEAVRDEISSGQFCGFSRREMTSFADEQCIQQYENEIKVSFLANFARSSMNNIPVYSAVVDGPH